MLRLWSVFCALSQPHPDIVSKHLSSSVPNINIVSYSLIYSSTYALQTTYLITSYIPPTTRPFPVYLAYALFTFVLEKLYTHIALVILNLLFCVQNLVLEGTKPRTTQTLPHPQSVPACSTPPQECTRSTNLTSAFRVVTSMGAGRPYKVTQAEVFPRRLCDNFLGRQHCPTFDLFRGSVTEFPQRPTL